ncbi:MAG: carbohydrate-binding domain-containing protein [Ruminiclostridium sp.]|nr:carbohydrate-binding domain-containing protein [Ruminiclostridium sp.]
MKKTAIIPFILLAVSNLTGCTAGIAESYTVAAQPYRAFTDEDIHSSECRIEFGDEVFVSGQGAWFSSRDIVISEGGIYTITGSYDGGSIVITTEEPVKLTLSDASITNSGGCAIDSKSEKLVVCSESGANALTGSGGDFGVAVSSEGAVLFVGSGTLEIQGSVFSAEGIDFGRGVSFFCEILRTDGGYIIPGSLGIN